MFFVSKFTFQRGYQQGVAHAWDLLTFGAYLPPEIQWVPGPIVAQDGHFSKGVARHLNNARRSREFFKTYLFTYPLRYLTP